jgi:hypothetical protein
MLGFPSSDLGANFIVSKLPLQQQFGGLMLQTYCTSYAMSPHSYTSSKVAVLAKHVTGMNMSAVKVMIAFHRYDVDQIKYKSDWNIYIYKKIIKNLKVQSQKSKITKKKKKFPSESQYISKQYS